MKKTPLPPAADSVEALRHRYAGATGDRLAPLVKDATRLLLRALGTRLDAHGVPAGHWNFLRVLWDGDGMTQRQLSAAAGVMEPTTFAAVRQLEEAGLVERRHQGENRKNIHVFLTSAGRALEARLLPLAVEVNQVATQGVPAVDIAATRRCLLAVIANLAAEERRQQELTAKSPAGKQPAKKPAVKRQAVKNRAPKPAPAKPAPAKHAPAKPARRSPAARPSTRARRGATIAKT